MGIEGNIKHQRGINSACRTSRTAPVQTHGKRKRRWIIRALRRAGRRHTRRTVQRSHTIAWHKNFDGRLPVQERRHGSQLRREDVGAGGAHRATQPALWMKGRTVHVQQWTPKCVCLFRPPPLTSNYFQLFPPHHRGTRFKDYSSLACSTWWPVHGAMFYATHTPTHTLYMHINKHVFVSVKWENIQPMCITCPHNVR